MIATIIKRALMTVNYRDYRAECINSNEVVSVIPVRTATPPQRAS